MAANNRIFISCVSDEFQNPGAPFAGPRAELAGYLGRADCEVKFQEQFRQRGNVQTIRADADYIRTCAAVIHLVGEQPGSVAHPLEIADFLDSEPEFLAYLPELRAELGDCSDLTYTQWEAFVALHCGVPLFVYRTAVGEQVQRQHLARLRLARKFPGEPPFDRAQGLLGQLIGDLREIIPLQEPEQRLAPPRFLHHAAEFFLGRDAELARLDQAWAHGTNVLAITAWGGVGKTTLIAEWVQTRWIARNWRDGDGRPSPLDDLPRPTAIALLRRLQITGSDAELADA